jgi:hypothetical protein
MSVSLQASPDEKALPWSQSSGTSDLDSRCQGRCVKPEHIWTVTPASIRIQCHQLRRAMVHDAGAVGSSLRHISYSWTYSEAEKQWYKRVREPIQADIRYQPTRASRGDLQDECRKENGEIYFQLGSPHRVDGCTLRVLTCGMVLYTATFPSGQNSKGSCFYSLPAV